MPEADLERLLGVVREAGDLISLPVRVG